MTYYTHAGLFHCDEVMGYAICKAANVAGRVERLTDITNIPTNGIVADIGREWIPTERKFDHHQGFFTRPNGYPLASAGMLWQFYGLEAISNTIFDLSPSMRSAIFHRVDERLIQGIDAHDADSQYKVSASCSAGEVDVLALSVIVSKMNGEDVNNQERQLFKFINASELCHSSLIGAIKEAHQFLLAKERFTDVATFPIPEVCVLSEGMPWKEIVHESYPDCLYVISPSNHPGSPYSMIAVPVEPTSRETRKPIERPSWFEGFIHQGKWIAGGESEGQLLELAKAQL